ncbi:MAG: hypothetical protein RLZZ385_2817 [Pseudomonadota bacterium]|jgi:4-diphosphocytidyl-2-C-methyl-D-erythritol kinase
MNPGTAAVNSPAKLNLFLHVTGRRPDGYHDLQTVFQLLDLCDRLRFEVPGPRPGVLALHSSQDHVPLDDNLVLRAARALREAVGRPELSATIYLHKIIPLGAGLGGGSSNAALTLLTLNRLWQTGLDNGELSRIGLSLGADVPLFIRGRSAFASGVGERLEPLDLPPRWYLILWPGVSVSTTQIFSHPQLTRHSPAIKIADFLAGGSDWAGLRNDCEPVVRAGYPQVALALDWLQRFGRARMTGSGSSVFADFPTPTAAQDALASLPAALRDAGAQGFIARGINELP